ncbi:hypothetical protein DWX43_08525 [Clostridium sp. AF19-22AC]|jgi:predicted transcriptional regulator|uniref:hypothetical protein n=1 Tax=Clostridia TaxID=186801 RepID=UPI000E4D61D0|nr:MULTISPECIES: hypothetical protein [Clostridia]RHR30210.1 hypothetical protein DWX43_08525 [Clostridium sp. AF19-22AC]
MCTILLSINPEHVNNIFSGKKLYEFRKVVCKRNVEKILIYSTSPVKKVTGEAYVEKILYDKPEKVWKKTKQAAGIDKEFFDQYYANSTKAVAFQLKKIKQYKNPKDLEEYGIKCPPQSFIYVENVN